MTALTRRSLFTLMAAAGVLFARKPRAAEGADEVGKVTRIRNAAFAMQDALPRKLEVGSGIQLGDVISTGKGARVEIVLNDGAEVTLGERTHFVVQEFIMSNTENNAVMRLLEGAFKVTSGKLMDVADAGMVVETNSATIGIRGTTFWGGTLDGGFEVALLGGKGVYVETRAGYVDLNTVGDGTRVPGADQSPTTPTTWPRDKVAKAMATVTF